MMVYIEGLKHRCGVYILKCVGKGLSVTEFCLVQRTEVQLWLLHSVLPAPAEGRSSSNSKEGPTAVKLYSTSGTLPGLDLIKMMLVYKAATESSPDEEPPYSKRHLRWIFLARVLSLVPPAWWAVDTFGAVSVNAKWCCSSAAAFQWCTTDALALLRCAGGAMSGDTVGRTCMGRERHGPAFYLGCFAGWAICCVCADSVSVDTASARH